MYARVTAQSCTRGKCLSRLDELQRAPTSGMRWGEPQGGKQTNKYLYIYHISYIWRESLEFAGPAPPCDRTDADDQQGE